MKITPIAQPQIDTEYVEFAHEPQRNRVVVVTSQGYETNGVFVAVNVDRVFIEGDDYDALMAPNASGKKAGQFRMDDVTNMVAVIKARQLKG